MHLERRADQLDLDLEAEIARLLSEPRRHAPARTQAQARRLQFRRLERLDRSVNRQQPQQPLLARLYACMYARMHVRMCACRMYGCTHIR